MLYVSSNTFDEVCVVPEPDLRGYETDDEYPYDELTPDEVDLDRLRGD